MRKYILGIYWSSKTDWSGRKQGIFFLFICLVKWPSHKELDGGFQTTFVGADQDHAASVTDLGS